MQDGQSANIANALKSTGSWYMSFKKGEGAGVENGRYFLYFCFDVTVWNVWEAQISLRTTKKEHPVSNTKK